MALWFAIAVLLAGLIVSWVLNVSPPGRYGQFIEEFFPWVMALVCVFFILRVDVLLGFGIGIVYGGIYFVSKRINKARLSRLDKEARQRGVM